VTVRIEDERRVLVGKRGNRSQHGLVAGGEREAPFEARPSSQPLFEPDVLACRRLRTGGRKAAGVLFDRALCGLFDARVGGQAEVIVRAEVDHRTSRDAGAQAARIELPEERIQLLVTGLAHAREIGVRASLCFDPTQR
jgi:hypothetical protein